MYSTEPEPASISIDLDAVATLTRRRGDLAAALGRSARLLADVDADRWVHDGPAASAAVRTGTALGELAYRLTACGVRVDALVADLGRASTAFAAADGDAVSHLRGVP